MTTDSQFPIKIKFCRTLFLIGIAMLDRPSKIHIQRGLLWFAGGVVVTFIGYSTTKAHGGGVYIVASGAILWGILEFLYGLVLFGREKWQAASPPLAVTRNTPIQSTVGKPLEAPASGLSRDQEKKWSALVEYDSDVKMAVDELRPYGQKWVSQLARDFFALQEDKQYLPRIIAKLENAASAEAEDRKARRFHRLFRGEACNEVSLEILHKAEAQGYSLMVDEVDYTIVASKDGRGTTYLRSNYDIQRFGNFL